VLNKNNHNWKEKVYKLVIS